MYLLNHFLKEVIKLEITEFFLDVCNFLIVNYTDFVHNGKKIV